MLAQSFGNGKNGRILINCFFFQVFTNIIGNIIRNLLVFIAKCYLKIRLTRRHVVSKMIIHEQVAIKLQKVLRSKLLTSSLSELISAYTR